MCSIFMHRRRGCENNSSKLRRKTVETTSQSLSTSTSQVTVGCELVHHCGCARNQSLQLSALALVAAALLAQLLQPANTTTPRQDDKSAGLSSRAGPCSDMQLSSREIPFLSQGSRRTCSPGVVDCCLACELERLALHVGQAVLQASMAHTHTAESNVSSFQGFVCAHMAALNNA